MRTSSAGKIKTMRKVRRILRMMDGTRKKKRMEVMLRIATNFLSLQYLIVIKSTYATLD